MEQVDSMTILLLMINLITIPRFFDEKNNDMKDPNGKEVVLNYKILCNSILFYKAKLM